MVFSAANDSNANVQASQYGVINIDIRSTPLIANTTVRDYILFDCVVTIYNCTKATLSPLLNSLQSEIITKVDRLLAPLNGTVDDGNPGNYAASTIGLGTVNLKIQPTRLKGTSSSSDEVIFAVEIQLISCNRTRLVNILNGLNGEIMDKVNDIL